MQRSTLETLQAADLDLLIVGGGIIGCGVARDAALRGFKVGLVECEDFGAGTTSRSTRLIHGGLRYLELLDFDLVRSDMREREILLHIAPHLVRPLPFLIPMYGWPLWKRLRLRVGMVLYDLLSYDKSLPWHRFLSRRDTLRAEPRLNPRRLKGAAKYWDAQVEFPERLALANALGAAEHGALLSNHTTADSFARENGRVVGVVARDLCTGQVGPIRARLTINATGPWLDRSLAGVEEGRAPLLRTTKGVHLVVPPLSRNAILLIAESDNRVFFVVPWLGYSMVGTTDTDYRDDPTVAQADPLDVSYLLRETESTFPEASRSTVYYSMAGVRALVRKDGIRKESQVSRKHTIRDHARVGGPEGLVSVVGGKITAYRLIAEEVTDLAARRLGRPSRSPTACAPLPGGNAPPEVLAAKLESRAAALQLNDAALRHLVGLYGSRADGVLAIAEGDARLAEPICPHGPSIAAQALYAVREEAATTLADVLLRRTPVGLAACLAMDCLDRVAQLVGGAAGWNAARRDDEIAAYRKLVSERYAAPLSAAG